MQAPIRVFIVDSHPLICEGLQSILAWEKDMLLVGQAATVETVFSMLQLLQPDVMLLEVVTVAFDGACLIRKTRRDWPKLRVILLTNGLHSDAVLAAIEAGAVGYVGKEMACNHLLATIRAVMRGEVVLPPALCTIQAHLDVPLVPAERCTQQLTKRELLILTLLAQGLSNQQIAAELKISRSTVGVHVSHLLAKLGLENRTKAALFALQHGLLP
ncbi:LuxR C-terminal-related transcriptional regulator [Candidatus Viridilinea mediisalina]|uniref:DNA-binding response regulator n=1 Tax=Candidatus Viridilinea mediisalina TaxID=2024553 RepID=A0A2A6RFI6_9CHLR|nr:response regulator transcription factor [Candidatus Viridilinea mediisalina]PDW01782.1 hypothetical protein CJ255_17335 [Candidatus Viridilinea mediisalina]